MKWNLQVLLFTPLCSRLSLSGIKISPNLLYLSSVLLEKKYLTFKVVGKGKRYKYERNIIFTDNQRMETFQGAHTGSLLKVLKNETGGLRRWDKPCTGNVSRVSDMLPCSGEAEKAGVLALCPHTWRSTLSTEAATSAYKAFCHFSPAASSLCHSLSAWKTDPFRLKKCVSYHHPSSPLGLSVFYR